jgi:uncharacterized protein (TIRG00374 family)
MNTALMAHRARWWRWLAPVAVLALVGGLASVLPWSAILTSLRATSVPVVGVAACATLLAITARALLFWRLLRQNGAASLSLAVRATFTAVALNSMLVGQAGEAGRVLLVVKESQQRSAQVIAAVVFEHAMVSAIYLVLLICAGALLPMPETLARWRMGALLALATLGAALLLLAQTRGTRRPTGGHSSGALVRLIRGVNAFLGTLRHLAAGGHIAGALSLAAAHWCLQLCAFFATVAALGYPMPATAILIAFLAVSASGSVRLTPGNAGVTQVVFAGAAGVYGVPLQEAVAVAVLWQLVQTGPAVIVALAFAPRSLAMVRPARHPWAATAR